MRQFERGPELVVRVLVERVEVHSEGSGKQDGVLRDDGQVVSEFVESKLADVDAVDLEQSKRDEPQNVFFRLLDVRVEEHCK